MMEEQAKRTVRDENKTLIYQAFADEMEKMCGEREPDNSPYKNSLPFYQILDLLAARAADALERKPQ